MNTRLTNRSNQFGVGLVELMVAVALGLVLLAGISQIYLSSKHSYRTADAVTRLQENGRFAIIKLQEDLRMAGYFGCGAGGLTSSNFQLTINLTPDGDNNQTTMYGDFDVGITGEDGDGAPDNVTIMYTKNTGIRIVQKMTQTSANLKVTPNTDLSVSDILLVCDVGQGDVFQMTGPSSGGGSGPMDEVVHNTGVGDPGNYSPGACTAVGGGNAHCLSKSYDINAKVLQMEMVQYTIAPGTAGTSALFRTENGGTPMELVEGVENMQIRYGIDVTGDRAVDRYVSASEIGTWDQVMSARVSLLLRSVQDNITQTPQTYTYDADGDGVLDPIVAGDNRLRRVFTTTVNIRNRTL